MDSNFPKIISILGCGWLGFPMAQYFVEQGCAVNGSTTTPAKFPSFKKSRIEPFLLYAAPPLKGDRVSEFFQSKVLFLNIPFHRGVEDPEFYKRQIISVVDYVEVSTIDFVIFASSTSIYPDSLDVAYEDMAFSPNNLRSQVLWDTEQMLLKNKNFKTTIIRFAGLYGGDRKIGRFLAGGKALSGGESPVNLVHLEDCVALVAKIIEKNIHGKIFNVCSDEHPVRRELYTKAAIQLGLEPPQFIKGIDASKKIVSNQKIKDCLGYRFKHPDPLDSI